MDVIQHVKAQSSSWVKKKAVPLRDFRWQGGYGAFSVSESNVERVRRYLERQEDHHRVMSFEDELRALLRRHNIELDERYLWT